MKEVKAVDIVVRTNRVTSDDGGADYDPDLKRTVLNTAPVELVG